MNDLNSASIKQNENRDAMLIPDALAFREGMSYRRNICIDWWRHLTPTIMAEGYKELGDMGVENSKSIPGRVDRFFYPIASSYRQYLELQLKNLIRIGIRYLPEAKVQDFYHHSLDRLWESACKVIASHWGTEQQSDFALVQNIVLEFHSWDPTGQGFRYYTDKKGNVNLEKKPKLVDLKNLRDAIEQAHSFLSTCQFGIECELEQMDDMSHYLE